MVTVRRSSLFFRSVTVVALSTGLCSLPAQTTAGSFAGPRAEAGVFGGASWPRLQQTAAPATAAFQEGGLVGVRATQNLAPHFAIEELFSWGVNNSHVPLSGQSRTIPLSSHTYEGFFGVVGYLTGSHSRIRPFLKVGVGGYWFDPQDDKFAQAKQSIGVPSTANAELQFQPALVAGTGIKIHFSRTVGMRLDGDASYMVQPHYKLPGVAPAIPLYPFIPTGGTLWQFQATAGLFFVWGRVEEALPPLPPTPPRVAPPPPPAPTLALNAPALRTLEPACPGETAGPITLTVEGVTNLPGHRPSYRWTVNDTAVGGDTPTYSFAIPARPGNYRVAVAVSDDASASSDRQPAPSVNREMLVATVREYQPPTITGSASPTALDSGDRAALSISAQGGACGGQVTYTCRADEGTVTGTPPNLFDSRGVAFDLADRSRSQSRTVNIACTVTDARGGTASAAIPVAVSLPAVLVSQRLDDIVFPSDNSRVNNCGKRILLEELYPMLIQHPDWDLVLVGHTSPGERPATGSRAAQLDRQRILNVVASLTAGTDTCQKLELGRIKVAYAGAEQKSEPRPGFCSASTRVLLPERAGQSISEKDANSKNRRVEIYVVPRGAALPEAATSMEVVPASIVSPLGCPK